MAGIEASRPLHLHRLILSKAEGCTKQHWPVSVKRRFSSSSKFESKNESRKIIIAKFHHELLGSTADISTKMQFLLAETVCYLEVFKN